MAITVGTDTYVTVAQFLARAVAKGWTDLAAQPDATKEELLKDAFLYLNASFGWKGQLADLSQVPAWPRVGVTDHEGRTIDPATVPTAVETAQMEIAYLQYTNGAILESQDAAVKSVKAGSVSVVFENGSLPDEGAKIPHIARLLTGLYTTRAGQKVANASLLKA